MKCWILILRNPAVGHKLIEGVHIQLRLPFPEHLHGKGLGGEKRELNEQLLFGLIELCHVENGLQIRKRALISAGCSVLAEGHICGSCIRKAMVQPFQQRGFIHIVCLKLGTQEDDSGGMVFDPSDNFPDLVTI